MNWDELKQVWGGQPMPAESGRDCVALEQEFAARHRKLRRTLFWRDLREAAAGVFVAAVFARVGWLMGRHGWPVAIAVLLMLALSGFFVWERVRARRAEPAPDAPLLVRLEAEIGELRRQHFLLSRVATWYFGPCVLAGAIFGGTVIAQAPTPAVVKVLAGGVMVTIFALSGWGVIAINRRAVRGTIEPRLQELEMLRREFLYTHEK